MEIREPMAGDIDELKRPVRLERVALLRDRYRSVLLALKGKTCPQIMAAVGRSRRSVQDWVCCYCDGGIDALPEGNRTGRPAKLTRELEERLRARLDAGASPRDGVCAFHGEDVVRILEAEFGVKHTLGSIYGVLDRLGYTPALAGPTLPG